MRIPDRYGIAGRAVPAQAEGEERGEDGLAGVWLAQHDQPT
jgi:hypothetical protein